MTDNVDRARSSYEAFARGDLDGALAMMHDDIEWHQAQGLPHGGIYRGLATVRAVVFDPIDDEWWDGFGADPEEFVALGDHVAVIGRYTARSRTTGAPLDVPFLHLWTFRDGLAVRFRQYTDTHGWVSALGVD
jgi:ketosteroid isomerase-like protein